MGKLKSFSGIKKRILKPIEVGFNSKKKLNNYIRIASESIFSVFC